MNKFIKKYEQIIIGSIFIFYLIYTLLNAIEIANEVVIATLLTFVLYIQSVGEFLYFYNKKNKPRLQDWLRLMLFISLVLNFMSIVNMADKSAVIQFSVKNISLLDSPFTMTIIIFAFLALDIAYLIGNNIFHKPKITDAQYIIKRRKWIFWILSISTGIQAYLLLSGLSGYGSDLKYTEGVASLVKILAGVLNPFALIVSAYIMYIENSKVKLYKTIFYINILLQIFLGLLSGMKENTLTPILYITIVFLISGKKIPKKMIYIGVFVFILLYPINNAYRDVVNDPYLNTNSHTSNMSLAINRLMTEPISKILDTGVTSYKDRGAMYPYLQYSINIEPSWDYYKNMTRYIVLPIVWIIPRALWEDKPKADIGQIFYIKLTGRDTTSVTPTTIGWAYLEGGLIYIILIFILLGLLLEFIEKSNKKSPIILIMYIIIFHKVIKPEWDLYFTFSYLIQSYIMYFILLKLIGIKKINSTQDKGYSL